MDNQIIPKLVDKKIIDNNIFKINEENNIIYMTNYIKKIYNKYFKCYVENNKIHTIIFFILFIIIIYRSYINCLQINYDSNDSDSDIE